MKEKKRIKYIDLCKGLGILMVTLGHVTTLANPLDRWMSSMKLSIFFVAAGYLICYTNSYEKQTLKRYIVKLIKSLMVPYILFSAFGIAFRYFAMVMQNAVNMDSIKSYIFATITLRGIFALWFLPVLFFAEILFLIGMIFSVVNIYMSQQNMEVDMNHMDFGIYRRNPGVVWSFIRFSIPGTILELPDFKLLWTKFLDFNVNTKSVLYSCDWCGRMA